MNGKKYKVSKYNLMFPLTNERYIVYNLLRDSISILDSELKEMLEQRDFDNINNELLKKMEDAGVIIDARIDELKMLKTLRRYNLGLAGNYLGLVLVMTYSCNLRCPYCYEGTVKEKGGILDKKNIDTILKFAENRIQVNRPVGITVVFYGGEPLLNWKGCKYTLKKLEKLSEEKGVKYSASFITNGTLINDQIIEAINEYNIKRMQITLDGPKDIHDKRRIKINGEGTFDEIIENTKLIKEGVTNKSFALGIRINVDKTNYTEIPKLLDFLKQENLNDIPIHYGIVREGVNCNTCTNALFFRDYELANYIPHLWSEAYQRGFKLQDVRTHTSFGYCMYDSPFYYAIDPTLKVYPCLELVGNEKYVVGSIDKNGNFIPTPFYYDAKSRDALEVEECKTCNFLPICMGGCAVESIRKHGHPNGPGCVTYRYLWKEGLKFYLLMNYSKIITRRA